MYNKSDITLIIPAKYESESLPIVLEELKKFDLKKNIILEETDLKTIESIKDYNCKIIFQKGRGYGDALITGINSLETNLFCIFNADGSFNPNEINKMIEKINFEKADIIFGSRYEKNCGSDDDTLITKVGNYVFTKIGNIFFSVNISDILYTYLLGKTKSFKKLNLKCKDFSLCVEMPIKAQRFKMNYSDIASYERKRIAGEKKVNEFKDGFKILYYMIKSFFNY